MTTPSIPFEIRPGPLGWTWRVSASDGTRASGEAPSRALAAAHVIRVLTHAARVP